MQSISISHVTHYHTITLSHVTINGSPYFDEHLKVRNIFARWVPHLLTDAQNRQRVKVAKKLLQMFQTYDKKQIANVVTGDENRVYYFEPVRKVSNKISATKHRRRPIIVRWSLSARKVWYAIFFAGEEVAIKMPLEKGKNIMGKYYKDIVLEKLKNIRNDALSLVLNISVFFMALALLMPLKYLRCFRRKKK